MKTIFNGVEFELDDDDALRAAVVQRAQVEVSRIPAQARTAALEQLVAELTAIWLRLGATIVMARAHGANGLTLMQVNDVLNNIGDTIGMAPQDVISRDEADKAQAQIEVVPPLVDACGDPILPGPQVPTNTGDD